MGAVDVDFEAEGLLDGLEGRDREARIALLERLAAEGFELGELRAAASQGRLAFLLAERVIGGAPRYTAREIAEQAGIPVELLAELRRAQGLPLPDPDERVFTEADIETGETVRAFAAEGLSAEQMLSTTRILGRGLAQAAVAMRSIALELVLEPGATELDLAERYAEKARRLVPLLGPMVEQMLRLHLRNMVESEAITYAERSAGRLPGARDVAVAFADLVGFTRLGEELEPERLGAVADRLGVIASDRVEPPVRLVKTIGDAVMLVCPEVPALIDCALDLVDAAAAEGEAFPLLRAGIAAGPALQRAGDWYGSPVNLASRLTALARPGSVLATRDIRDAAPDRYQWSSAGPRRVRGVHEPVRVYRVRRLEASAA
jgi:adenylate cyclase